MLNHSHSLSYVVYIITSVFSVVYRLSTYLRPGLVCYLEFLGYLTSVYTFIQIWLSEAIIINTAATHIVRITKNCCWLICWLYHKSGERIYFIHIVMQRLFSYTCTWFVQQTLWSDRYFWHSINISCFFVGAKSFTAVFRCLITGLCFWLLLYVSSQKQAWHIAHFVQMTAKKLRMDTQT